MVPPLRSFHSAKRFNRISQPIEASRVFNKTARKKPKKIPNLMLNVRMRLRKRQRQQRARRLVAEIKFSSTQTFRRSWTRDLRRSKQQLHSSLPKIMSKKLWLISRDVKSDSNAQTRMTTRLVNLIRVNRTLANEKDAGKVEIVRHQRQSHRPVYHSLTFSRIKYRRRQATVTLTNRTLKTVPVLTTMNALRITYHRAFVSTTRRTPINLISIGLNSSSSIPQTTSISQSLVKIIIKRARTIRETVTRTVGKRSTITGIIVIKSTRENLVTIIISRGTVVDIESQSTNPVTTIHRNQIARLHRMLSNSIRRSPHPRTQVRVKNLRLIPHLLRRMPTVNMTSSSSNTTTIIIRLTATEAASTVKSQIIAEVTATVETEK